MKSYLKLLTVALLFFASSCHVGRFIIYNFADVNDYKKFPQVTVSKNPDYQFTFISSDSPLNIDEFQLPDGMSKKSTTLAEYHKETKTTAFLIIRNDSILYENYFGGDEEKILTSFSVSKSYIGTLIGIALDEGKIKDVNEPITNYIDYWDGDERFSKITIAHLLDMKSGFKYEEGYYNPFGDVARYYYGRHLERYIRKIQIVNEPGQEFDYISVNTFILSLILEKATGMPTEQYLEQKIWKPLGMEFDASMNKDRKKGVVKAFAGLNAKLRDYAKFGRLYLHYGNWEGQQIISREWVERLRTARLEDGKRLTYRDQWYIGEYGDFSAIGFMGQYIYVFPDKNLIIVRTGKKSERWLSLLQKLALSEML